MSNCKGFDLTNTFADILTEQRVIALPATNGILSDIVNHVNVASDSILFCKDNLTDTELLDHVGDLIQSVLGGEITVSSDLFYRELETLVSDQGKLVSTHIGFARTVVTPIAVALAEKYQAYLSAIQPKDAASEFSIVNVKPAAILTDGFFIEALQFYKGRKLNPLSTQIPRQEARSSEELLEMLMTAETSLSASIQEWIFSKPQGWIESLWLMTFCSPNNSSAQGDSIGDLYLKDLIPAEAAEASLAIHLWCKSLLNAPGKANVKASTSSFEQILDYTGTLIYASIQRIALANSSSTLVLKYVSGSRTMYVNGDLYPKWLEEGNVPEILLGMACSGNINENINVIREKAESLINTWNQFVTVYEVKEFNNRHVYSRRALIQMFNESLNNCVEEEKEVRLRESYFAATRIRQAEAYLDTRTMSQLEDVFEIALYLTAKLRFNYTSAYEILRDIDVLMKSDKKADVREAALIATINYLGDFLAENISLKTY